MGQSWDPFLEAWGASSADDVKDGVERLVQARPKTKAGALKTAREILSGASDSHEIREIARTLVTEVDANDIKHWAKSLTNKSLGKLDGIDAILDFYFAPTEDDAAGTAPVKLSRRANADRAPASERRGPNTTSSKALLRSGKRQTTFKEYFAIVGVDADDWRKHGLTVTGACLKCHEQAAFESATGQNLGAVGARVLEVITSPLKLFGMLTKTGADYYRCTACNYLQKVCETCEEICETTAGQCKGCGHEFG